MKEVVLGLSGGVDSAVSAYLLQRAGWRVHGLYLDNGTAYPTPDGGVHIVCDSPVRAPAPGQSAVLYDGERVLGGGFIT